MAHGECPVSALDSWFWLVCLSEKSIKMVLICSSEQILNLPTDQTLLQLAHSSRLYLQLTYTHTAVRWGTFIAPVWLTLLQYIISPPSPLLCSSNFAQSLCTPPAGGPTFCLSDRVKIAPLQGSLAASVFPFLFVGNWKCSETAWLLKLED